MGTKQTIISKEDLQTFPVIKKRLDFGADALYQLIVTSPLIDSEGKSYIQIRKLNKV